MSQRAATLLNASIVYIGLGIVIAAIGPLLPGLARQNGVDLSAMGLLFTGFSIGAILAQIAGGAVADRLGRRPVFLLGVVFLAAASAGLVASRSFGLTVALSGAWGVGLGATELAANVLITELFAERSVSVLNLLNGFFGLGAFAGPAIASLTLRWWQVGTPAVAFGALILASQIPVALRIGRAAHDTVLPILGAPAAAGGREGVTRSADRDGAGAHRGSGGSRVIYRSALLWALGATLLLYVGEEQMVGGWTAVYMQRTTALSLASAALVASAFWIAYTASRACAAALAGILPPRTVLATSILIAAFGTLIVNLGVGSEPLSVAGFLLTGFGFGPIYPTLMAMTGRSFPEAAGRAIGAAGALASVGGMLLPFLDGTLIIRRGPIAGARFAFAVVLGIALFAVVALLLSDRHDRAARERGPARPDPRPAGAHPGDAGPATPARFGEREERGASWPKAPT